MQSQHSGYSSYLERPFDRSGLAAISDLETPRWKELFALLEKQQGEFLAKESAFRSPEYKCPRDPLHTWSRVWEYPYTYHHLQQARTQWPDDPPPRVVDLGSGVTFFPFALARLGYRVTCADVDPICATDIPRAAGILPHVLGDVGFRLIKGDTLPFQDSGIDAVYCVSVLEHIPTFEKTIAEIARILKQGGMLVLTIDVDLRGDMAISVDRYKALTAALSCYFRPRFPETTVHPSDMLTSASGPFALRPLSGVRKHWWNLKQTMKPLVGRKTLSWLPYFLAVQGSVLQKL